MPALISLLTDFGSRDPYVGAMKGVILGISSEVRVADLTHEIDSYDILGGALALAQSYPYFPAGTVHLVVVDPGVGSERRPILVSAERAHFVGPDNGVFEFVYQREPRFEVRHITARQYFRNPVSSTFHGRDIFAPVAAWLSTGVAPQSFGDAITDYVRLAVPAPERLGGGAIRGSVLHVDKFGNVLTNLTAEHLLPGARFRVRIGGRTINRLVTSYAAGLPDEIFAIFGSAGFLEVAARQASAAQMLGVGPGAEVVREATAGPVELQS